MPKFRITGQWEFSGGKWTGHNVRVVNTDTGETLRIADSADADQLRRVLSDVVETWG